MSVAGKRAGIQDGERSNLFFEAVRIIKEMRKCTNERYPKYAVWENVPGAFSSNKGHDFHAVLEALCSVCDGTVSIPKPCDPKRPDKLVWDKAGEIVGDNYSVAWRTLDAQYWGVPQRRKRIYLVADFTSGCAGKILFKQDGLRGDMQTSNETGECAAVDVVGGVDGSAGAAGFLSTQGSKAMGIGFAMEQSPTLRAGLSGADVIILNDQGGSQINVETQELSPTLRANSHQHEPVIALQANGIDRADTAGCNGCGWRENEMYTPNTIDRHAVCVENHPADSRVNILADGTCQTLTSRMGTGGGNTPMILSKSKPPRKYIIRRLTPTECARLQGFPDWWGQLAPYDPADAEFWEQVRKTHAEINGKKYKPLKNLKSWHDKLHTDGAEYKMWGNGIALPNAKYVLHGISEQGVKTLGSLFDGSGGFPLTGLMNGIEPLWASEVEPYPIAVTKSRFNIA